MKARTIAIFMGIFIVATVFGVYIFVPTKYKIWKTKSSNNIPQVDWSIVNSQSNVERIEIEYIVISNEEGPSRPEKFELIAKVDEKLNIGDYSFRVKEVDDNSIVLESNKLVRDSSGELTKVLVIEEASKKTFVAYLPNLTDIGLEFTFKY